MEIIRHAPITPATYNELENIRHDILATYHKMETSPRYFSDTSMPVAIQTVLHIGAAQNGRYFPDGISRCAFLNENIWFQFGNSRLEAMSYVSIHGWRH